MTLFPRKGDAIRAHSVFFQAGQVRDKDIGITLNLGVTRASASSVTIQSGNYKYNNAIYSYGGTTLTGIPVAGSGKHRYDIVVLECSTGTAKYIQGSEDVPNPYSGGFLNNRYPSPPELESENQILLAVYKVTSTGIPAENHGNYCVSGVANVQPLLSSKLGVTGGDAHKTRHQSGGADAIKLDDLSTPDDNTDLDSSTTKHGLMPKFPNTKQALLGDKSWATRKFDIDFPFGDGGSVMAAGQIEIGIPVACKIVKVSIWEVGRLTSSVTCTLYKRTVSTEKGSAIGTYAISSSTYYESGALNLSLAEDDILRVETSGITDAKQIVCKVKLEAT